MSAGNRGSADTEHQLWSVCKGERMSAEKSAGRGLPVSVFRSWCPRRRSQFEARANGVWDERFAEAGAHGVLGPPTGAVSGDDYGRRERFEIIEDSGDEWFEDRSVEVKATHDGVEGTLLG